MKRILFYIVASCFLIMSIVDIASAQEVRPEQPGSITLLNAVTATGVGAEIDMGAVYHSFACTVVIGGTAPTNVVVGFALANISGVYDSTNIEDTKTFTATPSRWYTVFKSGRYIKGNYVSKSAGDGTTSVTLRCTPSFW